MVPLPITDARVLTTCEYLTLLQQVLSMTVLCVTLADSSLFLELDGNVQNVIIMIFVLFVIMVTSTTCVIDFIGLLHPAAREYF